MDTINDLAFLGIGVWGDGETWARGGVGDFGGWCTRGSGDDWLGMGRIDGSRGRIHERESGGAELCLGRDDFDGVAEDGGGFVDGRHVVVV